MRRGFTSRYERESLRGHMHQLLNEMILQGDMRLGYNRGATAIRVREVDEGVYELRGKEKRTGMPYTTGAAPFRYLSIGTSRDCAMADVRVTGDAAVELVEVAEEARAGLPSRPTRRRVFSANLSMSLSVTSQRLATRAGLSGAGVSVREALIRDERLTSRRSRSGRACPSDQSRLGP